MMTGSFMHPKNQTKGSCVALMAPMSRDKAKAAEVRLVKLRFDIPCARESSNVPLFWNNSWDTVSSDILYVT